IRTYLHSSLCRGLADHRLAQQLRQLGVERRTTRDLEVRPEPKASRTVRGGQLDEDLRFAGKAGEHLLELGESVSGQAHRVETQTKRCGRDRTLGGRLNRLL